ncbi:MAG: tetratricopeptide repeat protein [Rhodocyclaceae bacterium]|nr:tetratricopeptide repeat protein [Rhodocyclaceae bacterium]
MAKLSPKQHQRLQHAFSLHETGDLEGAATAYRSLLRALPISTLLLSNLGLVLLQLGRREEGLPLLERSLRLDQRQPSVLAACAMDQLENGDVQASLEMSAQALRLAPKDMTALHVQGMALHLQGNYEGALACYHDVLSQAPQHVEAHCNAGLSFFALDRLEDALRHFDAALQVEPAYTPAVLNKVKLLRAHGRIERAVNECQNFLGQFPTSTEVRIAYAELLVFANKTDAACRECEYLVKVCPDSAECWMRYGKMLAHNKQNEQAISALENAYRLDPSQPFLSSQLIGRYLECCQWEQLENVFQSIPLALLESGQALKPFDTLRCPVSPKEQLESARYWGMNKLAGIPDLTHELLQSRAEDKTRLRVGLLTADVLNHPVTFLLECLMPALTRSKVEWVGIRTLGTEVVPEAFQKLFDSWLDVADLTEIEAHTKLSKLELDIAIDLHGITKGERIELFAMRLAPVQVSFLGYPGTTGTQCIDYLIADEYVVPESAQAFYTEKLAYMPDSFFVPNVASISEQAITRADEGLPEGGIVFCCFNNSFKITPDLFKVWMRILDRVEGSVLWLSRVNGVVEANLKREAVASGIDPERLIFAQRRESRADHLRRLQLADLFLDTFYYNAHTTASDALWVGVPVLTCPGETFASRVAGSLLKCIGLQELIATDHANYETLAVQLTIDRNYLTAIREKLKQNKESSPLFDMQRYSQNFERLLLTMWRRHEEGSPSTTIRCDARS